MFEKLNEFKTLNEIFKTNGYKLYLVGGTVRDFLLNKDLLDMDVVTDATPEEMERFLNDADFTFKKMGSVRCKINDVKFDITTLREEKKYSDSRHPLEITFVKDLKKDVVRRDFTINGLYMDEHFIVYDYVNGKEDLNKKTIQMIGNADKRIKEDPLRIIRAIRFAIDLDFNIDYKLEKSIKKHVSELNKLNIDKIKQDIKKIKNPDKEILKQYFDKFGITSLINVIE